MNFSVSIRDENRDAEWYIRSIENPAYNHASAAVILTTE
jgi:hypothetical protein